MGESVTDIQCLQQSVSFGRFERDSLCWERWSTFPTNKYLEEVEKCSTPGSVAQKKAYFEAHYKKIAARRAELLLDQEREREAELVNSEDAGFTSLIDNTSEAELDYEKTDIDNSVSETDQWDNEVGSFDDEVSIEHVHMKSHSTDNYYQENEVDSFDGEVSVEHIHMQSNSVNMLDLVNEIGSFDGDARVEHIHRKSNSGGMLNVENEMGSFDGDVSVEHIHMNSNSAGLLNLENEVGSFDDEHVHVKSSSSDGFSEESDVCNLPSEMSGHDDGDHTFNAVSELSNVTREKFENVVEFKDGNNTVDEASEVVKMEVTMDIRELKYGADVIDEVVKMEVTKDIRKLKDGADVIDEVMKMAATKGIRKLIDGADATDEVMKIEATEHFDKPDDGTDIIIDNNKRRQEETASTDSCLTLKIPELGKLKEPTSATEGVPSIPEPKGEELPQEKVKRTIVEGDGGNLMKVATSKKIQKATLVKKISSKPDTKKKPASPVPKRTTAPMPKSPMLSTPTSSKPELTRVLKSASRILDKKDNSFTPPTNKKKIGPQMKRAVPTSLHMSLSLGPLNADPTSFTMRKSLIMETMGDKDIVKRAFKAFQKAPQTSPSYVAISSATNQAVSRIAEQKGSSANTLQKKIEGTGRTAKIAITPTCSGQQGTRKVLLSPGTGRTAKIASTPTCSGQQGTRKVLLSPGVSKKSGADQRNVKYVAASFGPRVQLQENNQTAVSKKVEFKTRTNVFEGTHLEEKLKVEKAAQLKKPSESINSKPKVRSGYNHTHRGLVHKVCF